MTFDDIYDSQLAYVWHTLRRLGAPDRDREDLAHDVFLIVHRRLDSYDSSRSLRAWLFGIAYRVLSDYRRSARVRREVVTDAEPSATATGPAEAMSAREDRELVHAALAELELVRRAVFVMHELDGMTIPEIAEVIDAPQNTLYSHLRRARRELAAAVRRLGGGPRDLSRQETP
jgi:RNA polymerase sigma-70 factor (ECF subfamily)